MPRRCKLCGAANAACGTPTYMLPVDARITGVRVAGDTLVPDLTNVQPTDMTEEERVEYSVMMEAYERRRNRLKVRDTAMADGKAAHTSLSYVKCADGITRKMHPDVARQYVDMNDGAEIVREGALPVSKEGEVIGASKARVGLMFNDDGLQREDVQPMTSRTFLASDRTREDAVKPPIGAAQHEPVSNTATASTMDTGAGSTARTADKEAAPRMQKPKSNEDK